jgi:hypothetical protein
MRNAVHVTIPLLKPKYMLNNAGILIIQMRFINKHKLLREYNNVGSLCQVSCWLSLSADQCMK